MLDSFPRPRPSRVRFVLAAVALSAALAALPSAAQAAPSFAQTPVITEFDVEATWPKYPDHIEQSGWVSGMAIDKHQHIWLFKKGEDPVQVYRTDGTFVRSWGKGLFKSPHQLRIGPDGAIWVADFDRHVVQKYTPEGKLLQTVGTLDESGEDENKKTGETVGAHCLVKDAKGNIYIGDIYTERAQKFVPVTSRPEAPAK